MSQRAAIISLMLPLLASRVLAQNTAAEIGLPGAATQGLLGSNATGPNQMMNQMYNYNAAGGTTAMGNGMPSLNGGQSPALAKYSLQSTASAFGVTHERGVTHAAEQDGQFWVSGLKNWGHTDAVGVTPEFKYEGDGVILGYNKMREVGDDGSHLLLGAFGHLSDVNTRAQNGLIDRVDTDTYAGGLNAGYFGASGVYIQGVMGYINNRNHSKRNVVIGGGNAVAAANYRSEELYAYAELGKTFIIGGGRHDDDDEVAAVAPGSRLAPSTTLGAVDNPGHSKQSHKSHGRAAHKSHKAVEVEERRVEEPVAERGVWRIAPHLALQVRDFRQNAYTESGAGALSLNVQRLDLDLARAALGARFFYSERTSKGGLFVPDFMVRYVRELGDQPNGVTASFVGDPNTVFQTGQFRPGRDAIQVRAGMTLYTSGSLKFEAGYNGEYADNYKDNLASGRVSFLW